MARDDSVVGQGSGKGVDKGEDQEVGVVNTGDRLNVGGREMEEAGDLRVPGLGD